MVVIVNNPGRQKAHILIILQYETVTPQKGLYLLIKNTYKSLIVATSLFSLSLSGMQPSEKPLANPDYVITVRTNGNPFEITQKNRQGYTAYLKNFGIDLLPETTHLVAVTQKDQKNSRNRKLSANSDTFIPDIPAFLPLNLFTYDNAIPTIEGFAPVGRQSKTVEYKAASIRQLAAFTIDPSAPADIINLLKTTLKQDSQQNAPVEKN